MLPLRRLFFRALALRVRVAPVVRGLDESSGVVEEGAVIEGSVKMGKGGSLKSIDGGAKPDAQPQKKD